MSELLMYYRYKFFMKKYVPELRIALVTIRFWFESSVMMQLTRTR